MHVVEGADKMSARINAIIFIVIAAFMVVSSAVFFVEEREKVILLRLGQIERADYEPGIHFKIPFVNNVKRFDSRILTLDATPARYLTGEKKNVSVD
jgi:membrane protease subunit HflC